MNTELQSFLNNMFQQQAVAMQTMPEQEPQFSFFKDADGVWNLIEKGKVLGWINRISLSGAEHKYRAMSAISYKMEWFYGLDAARCWLFEQSH